MKCQTYLLLLCALAACSASPDARYYALSPSSSPASAATVVPTSAGASWMLSAVTVPDMLNRPQMIIKSGTNDIRVLEYDRWAEPLDSMTLRILFNDLTLRHGIPLPMPANGKAYKRITVAIDEFDADAQGHVYLSALWTIQTSGAEEKYAFSRTGAATPHDPAAMAAAMSRLLGNLADAIAAKI